MATWRIRLFGSLRVEGPEIVVERFETRRSALLLARLALSRQGSVAREALADALWPDDFPDATRLRLRKELSRLRAALGPARAVLWSDADAAGLELSLVSTDAREFLAEIRQAESEGSREKRIARLREALRLAPEPILPEWTEPWIEGERAAADEARLRALVEVGDLLIDGGEFEEALTLADRSLRLDPASERALLIAMRAHAGLGSPSDGLERYQRQKRLLRERDDAEPSTAVRAMAERLQRGGPAPSAAPSHPFVPRPLERIVGREGELAGLIQALRPDGEVRLQTLIGPGGVGKTRLALEVVHALRERYGGKAFFLSLADVADARTVESRTAEAVGALAQGATTPLDALVEALGDSPALLVLDNLEHLLRPAAAFVERLLGQLPALRVVATSRQALGIPGERESVVAPLDPESALRFFVLRAQAVRSGFVRTPQNEATLRAIAERLEGLPLAIHLAASRSHLLTPEQILRQLDSRLTFLVGRGVGEDRHRTMRDAIAWSDELLTEPQRRTLRALALFRGGWTLEAASAVCDEPNVLDPLGELVDRSLVVPEETEDGMRYRMLETIREYALGTLVRGEEAAFRCRHGEFFLRQANRLHRLREDRNRWQRLLAADLDNLRDALRWAERHHPLLGAETMAWLWHFWNIRGLLAEGREWARSLMGDTSGFPPTQSLGLALAGAAVMARCQGDHADALRWFEQARTVAEQVGNPIVLGFIYGNLPDSQAAFGDLDAALESARRSIEFHRQAGTQERFTGMTTLAGLHVARGEPDLAEPLLREALEAHQAMGSVWGMGYTLHGLAEVHWARGDRDEAFRCVEEAQAQFESIGEIDSLSRLYLLRAKVRPSEAAFYAQKALELSRRLGATDRMRQAEAMLSRSSGESSASAEPRLPVRSDSTR